MSDYLPDALSLLGLGLLVAGVAWRFGPEWALMVAGLALLAAGVAMARGQVR